MAARIGAVREAVGITAYHASEWAEALTELRAARRLTGDASHLPLMADCERAMGRPERALRVAQSADAAQLDLAGQVELRMVEAGARRDLGELDAALMILQGAGLDRSRLRPWSVRLWYAYADTLVAAGRLDQAQEWFISVAGVDAEGQTDAEDRLVELGVLEPAGDQADLDSADSEAEVEPADRPDAVSGGVRSGAGGADAGADAVRVESAGPDGAVSGGVRSGADAGGAAVGVESAGWDGAVSGGVRSGADAGGAAVGVESAGPDGAASGISVGPSGQEPATGSALFREPPSDPEPPNFPEPTDNSPD